MGETAAGRPRQPLPLIVRLVVLPFLVVGVLESAIYLLTDAELGAGPVGGILRLLMGPVMLRYWPLRVWALSHLGVAAFGLLAFVGVLIGATRYALLFWHNVVVTYFTGTRLSVVTAGFPSRPVNLVEEISRRPAGHAFVGMTPTKAPWGWKWKPLYVSARQKTMHRHVIGKTGSGKTASILWPSVLQDALDGKGILFMSAKGSDEEVKQMKAIAALTKREAQLKVFSLPAWNQPQLFSHTYNMIYVRPRTATHPGGDPSATAERVFSILPLGDNEYYNTQGQVMFTNLIKLLHGLVDEKGNGIPFVLKDLAILFRGIGIDDAWGDALSDCLRKSLDREAAANIQSQIRQLGNDVNKCFSGVVGAIDKFLSPLVNAYEPDIIIEDILQAGGLLYVQLPANLFKIQAPALGKVLLMDVQQEGSLRQVFRQRSQKAFAVTVDEFYNFADISVVDSLNKLRDANLEYTLAHQSIADLELVSKEFATAVWDNTRTKDILNQDNPELCEKIGKSIGTHQVIEKTVRQQQGALLTSLSTGDASTKLVETYKLHPNAIKNLERCGQGYHMSDQGIFPVAYGMVPNLELEMALPRKDQSKAHGLRLFETYHGRARKAPEAQAAGTNP